MQPEEDVDSETLQAQIDMSMSFVHNLVTSWIHPVHAAQLRTGPTHAERTLGEELRRPARLGVGAPIPGVPPADRDAVKLKHRLSKVGEKRPTSDQLSSQPQSISDDEEKGRERKRKIRSDPFAVEKSKKKKKVSGVLRAGPKQPLDRTTKMGEATKHEASSDESLGKQETSVERSKNLGIDSELKLLSGKKLHQPHHSPPHVVDSPSHVPSLAHVPGPAVASASRSTATPRLAAVQQPTRPPFPVLDHPGSQVMRNGLSLLNLDGPPGSLDDFGNANNPNNSRKKRKKRKKKRAPSGTGTGGNDLNHCT